MSTIAVMTSPAKGHLYPLVDTLIKLRSRGHSIVVKTLSSETQTLEDLGFTAIPLSDTLNDAQLDDWQATNSIGALNAVLRQLVSRMPHDFRELTSLIAETQPDMVMVDFTTFGGQIAAEASGLPWALWSPTFLPLNLPDDPPFGMGLKRSTGTTGALRDKALRRVLTHLWDRFSIRDVNALRTTHGLEPLRHTTDLLQRPPAIINFTAEPLEYSRKQWPDNVHLVGPGTWSPPVSDSDVLRDVTDPIALVTCSTEFQDDAELGQVAIDALEGTGLHTVVTTGALDPLTFRPKSQATVVDFLSHDAILDRCAVVICHGGMGITQKALVKGIPIVVLPFGRDQREVAERVRHCRAGEVLSPTKLTASALHSKVTSAMALKSRTAAVARQLARAGGAERAADIIESQLAHRTTSRATSQRASKTTAVQAVIS